MDTLSGSAARGARNPTHGGAERADLRERADLLRIGGTASRGHLADIEVAVGALVAAAADADAAAAAAVAAASPRTQSMAENLVTLDLTFASGGGIETTLGAALRGADGNEQKYADLREHATLRQETFPGHKWVLVGRRTGEVQYELTAAANPPVQKHEIDLGGAAAAAGGVAADEEADAVAGVWAGETYRFERVPRLAGQQRISWRSTENGGSPATLEQLEARVDTRWVWWMSEVMSRLSITGEAQYLIMSALTIASAYGLDTVSVPWPSWLREIALLAGFRRGPAGLVALILFVGGAVIAAAVPLRETSLHLYNSAAGTECGSPTTAALCASRPTAPATPSRGGRCAPAPSRWCRPICASCAAAAATTLSSSRCSRSAPRTGSAGSPSSRAVILLYVKPRHVIDGRLPLASTRSE